MYMCVCVCVCVRARVSVCVCVYLLLSDFFLLGQRDESLVFICILCSAKKKMRIILCSEKIFLSVVGKCMQGLGLRTHSIAREHIL